MLKNSTSDKLTIYIDQKILPGIIQDIAALIGLAGALDLVDHHKGTLMWIPVEFKPDHVLVKIVGPEAALKLINEYGGERLEIPKCENAIRAVRDGEIKSSDKSQANLAREYNLTVRQIRNIQKNMPEDSKQEALF